MAVSIRFGARQVVLTERGASDEVVVDWMVEQRFEGATGGFPVNVTSLTLVSATGYIWTFAVTYDGSGTVAY